MSALLLFLFGKSPKKNEEEKFVLRTNEGVGHFLIKGGHYIFLKLHILALKMFFLLLSTSMIFSQPHILARIMSALLRWTPFQDFP